MVRPSMKKYGEITRSTKSQMDDKMGWWRDRNQHEATVMLLYGKQAITDGRNIHADLQNHQIPSEITFLSFSKMKCLVSLSSLKLLIFK